MYRGGQLRDISEVSGDVGVKVTQQFRHLRPFTHPLSSSPSGDHDWSNNGSAAINKTKNCPCSSEGFILGTFGLKNTIN